MAPTHPRFPALLALALAACNATAAKVGDPNDTPGTGPCVEVVGGADCDTNGTGTGTGGTNGTTTGLETWIGDENPGSGDGIDLYEVAVDVEAVRVEEDGGQYHYETSLEVWIWDAQGNPVSGLDVNLDTLTLGNTALPEHQNDNGRYVADVFGYARTYTLNINPTDPATAFTAEAIGPEAHTFSLPPQPWDVTEDITVSWNPFGAQFANLDTRGGGGQDVPDTGSAVIPGGTLDQEAGEVGEERVRLRRWDVLDLDALPTSSFTIAVEIEKDNLDTVDPRLGSVGGDVELAGDLTDRTGDVYVLAWPDALEPGNDPPYAWTRIADGDFTDFGSYLLDHLEPGDYYLLAYLDADGSDVGQPAPEGPTDGDPWDDADVQIDPNGTSFQDFFLEQTWQGW